MGPPPAALRFLLRTEAPIFVGIHCLSSDIQTIPHRPGMSSNLVFILRQVSFDPLDDFLTLFLSTFDDFIFESLKLLSSLSVRVMNTVLPIELNNS